jgi:anti-sigma B factor antagonist
MEITSYMQDNTLIVTPIGKLDTLNAPQFGEEFLLLLEAKNPVCFLDLSQVSFLSSSGLQVLLAGAKTSKKNDTKFGVFGMNEMVNEVFTLSGFDNFIESFPTKETALTSLS